jgi:hypothetical protein
MGIRVQCDWCRETIEAGDKYVTVEIDGKVKGAGGPARVYCADGCAPRLLALLDANPDGPVDMGMEWRLVPIGEQLDRRGGARPGSFAPAPEPVRADADLDAFLGTLARSSTVRTSNAFRRQGISTLEQLDSMTDDELLALEGVSWKIRGKIRAFIAARNAAQVQDPQPDAPVASLDLSERTLSILLEHGVSTLRDLKRELRSLPNDRVLLNEIEAALDRAVAA